MFTTNKLVILLLACSMAQLRFVETKLFSSVKTTQDDDFNDDFDDFDFDDYDDYLPADTWLPLLGITTSAPGCEEDITATSTIVSAETTTRAGLRPMNNGICAVFRSLRDAIPMRQLVRITANHYKKDAKFRHAMSYLHTAQFKEVTGQIESSVVYKRMLLQFQDAGVDTSDLLSVGSIIECVLLPTSALTQGTKQLATHRSVANVGASRSLQSFTEDMYHAIPRRKFRSLVSSNLAVNSNFRGFYRVLRTARFKRDVLSGLANIQIADPLRLLRRNFINLRQLLKFVFRVFALGPRPI